LKNSLARRELYTCRKKEDAGMLDGRGWHATKPRCLLPLPFLHWRHKWAARLKGSVLWRRNAGISKDETQKEKWRWRRRRHASLAHAAARSAPATTDKRTGGRCSRCGSGGRRLLSCALGKKKKKKKKNHACAAYRSAACALAVAGRAQRKRMNLVVCLLVEVGWDGDSARRGSWTQRALFCCQQACCAAYSVCCSTLGSSGEGEAACGEHLVGGVLKISESEQTKAGHRLTASTNIELNMDRQTATWASFSLSKAAGAALWTSVRRIKYDCASGTFILPLSSFTGKTHAEKHHAAHLVQAGGRRCCHTQPGI